MRPTDALQIELRTTGEPLREFPAGRCFIMPEIDLEGFRFLNDEAGVYRGDWSVEVGEQDEVLSLVLDFHEHWDDYFVETIRNIRGVELTNFGRILEVRIDLPRRSVVRDAEYKAWPLSRFYSPSLDQMMTFVLLDFWSLVRSGDTEPGAAPNGGPAASVEKPNAPDGPPSVS